MACPLCGRRARRTHSRYERKLADLPWGEHAVAVRLGVRRMFCDNVLCERRVFTERLPGIAVPWARKTARLTERLTAVGLALGGAAGARLGHKLGLAASRNTLLRLVRRTALPSVATPAALGVDDWALRKGHVYGTVLVDLEQHRPVALLPDREAGTLAAWLREHPGIAVLARDRAGAYAKGARDGAPGAVQVADRFHLLQNLAEALELAFTAHARDLRAVEQARHKAATAEQGTVPLPLSEPQTTARLLGAERRERRLARHGQVWALYRQGWSGEKIARHLGIGRATTYRFLRSETFPERKGRSDAGRSRLDPWRHVVLAHWDGDRRNSPSLFRVLQQHGYRGSYPTLVRYLRRLRAAQGRVAPGGSPVQPRGRGWSRCLARRSPRAPQPGWCCAGQRNAVRRMRRCWPTCAGMPPNWTRRSRSPRRSPASSATVPLIASIPGCSRQKPASSSSYVASPSACRPMTTRCARRCRWTGATDRLKDRLID
jgi:transposase